MSRPTAKKKRSVGTLIIVVAAILICILVMTFPGVEEDATLSERLAVIFNIDRSTQTEESVLPTPDPSQFTTPQGEADEQLLALMEQFLAEDVEADFDRYMQLPTEFLPSFEQFPVSDLVDPDLQQWAQQMTALLTDWQSSIYFNEKGVAKGIDDWLVWSRCRVDLCDIVSAMDAKYNLSPNEKYVVQQYDYIRPIWQAQLDVQLDLEKQLIVSRKEWNQKNECYTLTYTNDTPFDFDLTIFGDYFTVEHYYYTDKTKSTHLMPGDSLTLYMRNFPEDLSDWKADWIVENYCMDGIDIYDYY